MNNVNEVPIDIDEMRLWAKGHMEEHVPPMTRSVLSRQSNIPLGTLGPWMDAKYNGRNDHVARKMLAYKQQVEATKAHAEALPVNPGYFETPTSRNIETLLSLAHTGRITVGGTGPGTGKTMTVREYEESSSSVFVATMTPSSKRLVQMIREVLISLGFDAPRMLAADASREVVKRLQGLKALLVIDEANHLSIDAIEEIRGWHDLTGVGICMLGNAELIREIRAGKNKTQLARLNSRIAWALEQDAPSDEDVRVFCDAWQISDSAIRKYLRNIATTKDSGGLREARQLVEIASLFAGQEDRGITLDDLRDVQSQRASRHIKA